MDTPTGDRIREIWAKRQEAGWTLQRLGEAMGYAPELARQRAHQFLRSDDPRLSSVQRFAKAVGVSLGRLVS